MGLLLFIQLGDGAINRQGSTFNTKLIYC